LDRGFQLRSKTPEGLLESVVSSQQSVCQWSAGQVVSWSAGQPVSRSRDLQRQQRRVVAGFGAGPIFTNLGDHSADDFVKSGVSRFEKDPL